MALLREIESYWSTRTEGYSEVNHKELQGMQRESWLQVLEEQFPQKDKEELKILDIGTGPGFFPRILAEQGYQVTAVDYTAEMLEKARENAGELRDGITFKRMDAQNLEFEDNSFDAVISRNLTWNLEKPKQAYEEWYRVLKPGGKIINFDANWYGYLYDEEKKETYLRDRENVEKENLDDHYLCTDIDRMERIALQMPLSAQTRPDWDVRTLKAAGFADISTDENIWNRVWSKEEKINYQSTPMFMVVGVKDSASNYIEERDSAILLEDVKPGEKRSGFYELVEDKISVPVTVIQGKIPGKTVLITAGVHAGEYVGIQASMELSKEIKAENVCGRIIIVKALCRKDFEGRQGSLSQEDGKNLNREFPGDMEGTITQQLAAAIVEKLHKEADYYIDLHSGDDYENLVPYIYYAGVADQEVVEMSRNMARQADVAYMVRSAVSTSGGYNYAAFCGIPSVLLERGGMGKWTMEEVGSTKKDVRSILDFLGIYKAQNILRTYYPLDVTDIHYQAASVFGCWYPKKKPGDLITKGETLGIVRDYEGNILEVSEAEMNGVILYQTESLQVVQDGPMIAYGKIDYHSDNRKDMITSYWTKRSGSFLEQRREELHSPLAGRFLDAMNAYLPKGKPLKILDVGCGTGFFTILLAKEGHQTTGIDLTPDMILHSRELAEEEKAGCSFQVMDGENLEFKDESFDVVVSRNLTWTLPDAQQAYKEWCRVLKPGGILLNFDADYGADDCTDMSELPENHAHHQLDHSLLEECENIKRQLPISSYARPSWDLAALGKTGITSFQIDLEIGKKIYIEKDEFYNPAPLFLLCGRKGA